jgi:hypothetical protein
VAFHGVRKRSWIAEEAGGKEPVPRHGQPDARLGNIITSRTDVIP